MSSSSHFAGLTTPTHGVTPITLQYNSLPTPITPTIQQLPIPQPSSQNSHRDGENEDQREIPTLGSVPEPLDIFPSTPALQMPSVSGASSFLNTPPESPVEIRASVTGSAQLSALGTESSADEDDDDSFSRRALFRHNRPLNSSQRVEKGVILLLEEAEFDSVAEFMLEFTQQMTREDVKDFGPMLNHRYSKPSYRSVQERHCFDPEKQPSDIRYAHKQIFNWAIRTIGDQVHREIKDLGTKDSPSSTSPGVPVVRPRLAATADSRTLAKGVETVTREDILSFNIPDRVKIFQDRAPVTWYVTQSMAAPRKNGECVVQFAAISAFVQARNRFANGYFQMHAGIWHLACKSHTDVKRLHCWLGLSIANNTSREALSTMAETGHNQMRAAVKGALERGAVVVKITLDNIQGYAPNWEGKIGGSSRFIYGTAGTVQFLEDCADDAFDLEDHLKHVFENKRANLTTTKLYENIDWAYVRKVQSLHVLRTLAAFTPQTEYLVAHVLKRFRTVPGPNSDGVAIHRM
ncbi:hypothetical protein VNI00_015015 [Paramarasmius palmivorus]|uniref:Uncharacterized protein n=1 Tax=Paramarasmius palmivorus TaxID=297713 RepID=A0AAW0BMU7_9AGAR